MKSKAFEKKDMAADKKAGVKEGSKKDVAMDKKGESRIEKKVKKAMGNVKSSY
jgi:hypothetical protein